MIGVQIPTILRIFPAELVSSYKYLKLIIDNKLSFQSACYDSDLWTDDEFLLQKQVTFLSQQSEASYHSRVFFFFAWLRWVYVRVLQLCTTHDSSLPLFHEFSSSTRPLTHWRTLVYTAPLGTLPIHFVHFSSKNSKPLLPFVYWHFVSLFSSLYWNKKDLVSHLLLLVPSNLSWDDQSLSRRLPFHPWKNSSSNLVKHLLMYLNFHFV